MRSIKQFYNSTCAPAKLYMILSLVGIVGILLQNIFESRKYCVGVFSCKLNYSNIFLFVMKIVYTMVWAIILDSLCENNYRDLAWGIVLFPIILMFVSIAVFMLYKKRFR